MPHILLPKSFSKLKYACSERRDGNMSFRHGSRPEVMKNRKRFFRKVAVAPEKIVVMNLRHSTKIKFVDWRDRGFGALKPSGVKADCLVTKKSDLFLFLLTGDCLPTILYDPKKNILALAHLSRHNTDRLYAKKIITTLKNKYQCHSKNIMIAIGPAIHQKSYIKDHASQQNKASWRPFIKKLHREKIAIDLIGYNKKQLIRAGVLPSHFIVGNIDTAASRQYFSHRRSVNTGQPEGRFATIVGINK
ncbi:MAG: polyphenol oxidase family protein [Patescibacteria group bacterium]|jgi:hypothetical protein